MIIIEENKAKWLIKGCQLLVRHFKQVTEDLTLSSRDRKHLNDQIRRLEEYEVILNHLLSSPRLKAEEE